MNDLPQPIFSMDAEKGVLGCILLDPNECMPECREHLDSPEAFYDMRYREIYNIMVEMHEKMNPISVLSIHVALTNRGLEEACGGLAVLADLENATPSAREIGYFIKVVNAKSRSRKLIHLCQETVEKVQGDAGEIDKVDTLIEEFEQSVMKIRCDIKTHETTLKKTIDAVVARIEAAYNKSLPANVMTGFVDLDRMCGGLRPGDVTVIAGYPGSGKTSMAMNIAEHVLLDQKKSVLVFTFEMSAEALVTRFIASHSKIDIGAIERGYLKNSDFKSITASVSNISASKLWIDEGDESTASRIRARARRMCQRHGLDIIIIDYLQLLGSGKVNQTRSEEVAEVSRTVKLMAKELKLPVIELSQLNDDGRLRESRAIGQDADNVWIMETKGELESDTSPVTLKIVKARNGPVGKIDLVFRKRITRFESCAKIEDDQPNSDWKEKPKDIGQYDPTA